MKRQKTSSDRISVYGVPRRYDLVSLLVISVAFAALFSLLRSLDASSVVIAVVLSFIVVVGLAQAILFDGRSPRLASLVAGMVLGPALIGLEAYSRGLMLTIEDVFLYSIFCSPVGYITGAVVGGVFLVSERLRTFIRRG